jgi:hypothetical protein
MQFSCAINPRVDGGHPTRGTQKLINFPLKCLIKARRDLVCTGRNTTCYVFMSVSYFRMGTYIYGGTQ